MEAEVVLNSRVRKLLRNFIEKVCGRGCWVWKGGNTGKSGYSRFRAWGTKILGHRFAWEILVGVIPSDLVVDHKCRNRLCVNPKHLCLTTQQKNILSGEGIAAKNSKKTHCKRGHELNSKNVRITKNKSRQCRKCVNYLRRKNGIR